MDSLDAMIVRDLVWKPADPVHAARGLRGPWDIARAMRLHGTTVKRRLAEMRASGALAGVRLVPAGPLVGRRITMHWMRFANAAAKREGAKKLIADGDAWEAHGFVGDHLFVELATPEGHDPHDHAAEAASRVGALESSFHSTYGWPLSVERVNSIDLRILAAFSCDFLRPVKDVARDVGVSPKTVSNRIRALSALGAFTVSTEVRPVVGDSTLIYLLDLPLDRALAVEAQREIANRFPLAFCRTILSAENAYVVLSGTPSSMEEQMMRAQSIPGVLGARVFLHHETTIGDSYRHLLLERAEEIATARRGFVMPRRIAASP